MPRYLVASVAGGTMTDVIVVDEEGREFGKLVETGPRTWRCQEQSGFGPRKEA